jgi:hypothetical protein
MITALAVRGIDMRQEDISHAARCQLRRDRVGSQFDSPG